MPYYFDALRTPVDDEHLWERLWEIWVIVHDDLMNVHFETEQEALDQVYGKSLDPNDMRPLSWNVARFRETDDRDNLLHFHDLALGALGTTEQHIKAKQLSADFLSEWSTLMSCHGFVVAAIMARGDDLQSRRAGRAAAETLAIDPQRQWFSHYFLRERPRHPSRSNTEAAVERLINAIVEGTAPMPETHTIEWFESFLNLREPVSTNERYGKLTKAFGETKLSVKQMRRLADLPVDDLPPLDLPIPPP